MLGRWRERRKEADARAVLAAQLKARVQAAFSLSDADTVAINEIACPDPGCPDLETVILIMRAGHKTRAVKIAGPMVHVSDADLARAAADRS
jgi:hypothetical protein